METGKVGRPKLMQFAPRNDAGDRLSGIDPADLASELWVDDGGGGRVLCDPGDPLVEVFELDPAEGEYVARFTPTEATTYYLTIAHADSGSYWGETIQVTANDLDDVAVAVQAGAAAVLLGIEGGPWQTGQAAQVTLAWRDRALNLFNPFAVRRIELIAPDAVTVLQGIEGGGISTPVFGKRRVTFNAPAAGGTHYVRVFYRVLAGDQEVFAVLPADVLAAAGAVVAGIITVEDLLQDYLAVIAGDDVQVALLKGPNGETLIPDRFIEAAIRRNAANVERLLEVRFGIKRYAASPELGDVPLVKGVDYDEEEDRYPWLAGGRTSFRSGKISLRHVPLVRITRARLIYGTRVLYEIPNTWITAQHRTSTLEIILDGSGTFVQKEQVAAMLAVLGDFYGDAISRNIVPNFWAFDYEAGLAEVGEDIVAVVAWRAVAEILGVAAVKANKLAVQSQSRSLDGVSRSQGVSDSQPGGRFSRLISLPLIQRYLDDKWLRETLKPQVRSSARVL